VKVGVDEDVLARWRDDAVSREEMRIRSLNEPAPVRTDVPAEVQAWLREQHTRYRGQ